MNGTGMWVQRTELPALHDILRVLTLQDYNTRVVIIGTMLLGLAGGVIGTFMLLRKRSLLSDAVSHATLPGIGIAFMVMVALGGDGKSLPGLLLGALISGLVGMGWIVLIRQVTRLKEDAALGIVLSVFFGLGIAILGVVQRMATGSAAGLESFIYGKTASMLFMDSVVIAVASFVIGVTSLFLFKEFNIVCFDAEYAKSQGWNVLFIDVLMMSLVVGVTVIGLQAVGLVLVIALLIIPPAAARFWTEHLGRMTIIAAVLGALAGLIGAAASALIPGFPAGAVIVVTAGVGFALSMVFGTARGVVRSLVDTHRFNRKIARQNLLRSLYEYYECLPDGEAPDATAQRRFLMEERSWSEAFVRRLVRRAARRGLVEERDQGGIAFTQRGMEEATRIVRNHRLWEMYLIRHADVATSRVDQAADFVEHVLGNELVAELEQDTEYEAPGLTVPKSRHALAGTGEPGRTEGGIS
jgi:manganese/zinc/iron transport system permease protein